MIYTECHEKLHTFVFYFQCQCKCILIKSVHVDYMPPVVYRTLMWRKFDPINVEYFERTSLCKFRKTRQLNLFECLLLASESLVSLDRRIGTGVQQRYNVTDTILDRRKVGRPKVTTVGEVRQMTLTYRRRRLNT